MTQLIRQKRVENSIIALMRLLDVGTACTSKWVGFEFNQIG